MIPSKQKAQNSQNKGLKTDLKGMLPFQEWAKTKDSKKQGEKEWLEGSGVKL